MKYVEFLIVIINILHVCQRVECWFTVWNIVYKFDPLKYMLACTWALNAESSSVSASPHTTGAAQMCRCIFALAQSCQLVKSSPKVVSVAKLSFLATSLLLLHVGFIICAQNSFRYCVCCRYFFLTMLMKIFPCRATIKDGFLITKYSAVSDICPAPEEVELWNWKSDAT